MSRYNHQRELTKKDYIYRTLFVVIPILILAFFCHGKVTKKYQYALNEPWEDATLIAHEAFDIYKPKEDLQRDKDSLRQYYEPYFEQNEEIGNTQIDAFDTYFEAVKAEYKMPMSVKSAVKSMLRECYQNGIVTDQEMNKIKQDKIQTTHIFSGKSSTTRSVREMYSQKSAYEFLMKQDESIHNYLQYLRLDQFVQPNLTYDAMKSKAQQDTIDKRVQDKVGRVMAGQKIVDQGQIVDRDTYIKLLSLEKYEGERKKSASEVRSLMAGQLMYITIFVTMLMLFFVQFRRDYLDSVRYGLLVTTLCMIFPIITYVMVQHHWLSVYVVPYCILPIFIRVFMDSRTAFIAHFTCIMLCALSLSRPFEFIGLQSLAGLVAIYSLRQLSQRAELFQALILVTLVSLLYRLCTDLLQCNFSTMKDFDWYTYIYICINGALLLISYLLLFPVERLFRFTSNVSLMELSNTSNNALLRELSERATGTFQHSMQVGNLAAAVADKIGAKSLLVRTGALYHDIGKLKDPSYFIENQGGVNNPHNHLPYDQSAQLIISHVKDGLELANKHKLPPVIKDFIRTHHGSGKAKYFYISYKNAYPDREIDEQIFTYPGPNPSTTEQAILMMADAVEAASRSLNEYTDEGIEKMVDRIVDGQMQEGFFARCPITFENITQAKDVFKDKLKSIYHTRIQYPELKKEEQGH